MHHFRRAVTRRIYRHAAAEKLRAHVVSIYQPDIGGVTFAHKGIVGRNVTIDHPRIVKAGEDSGAFRQHAQTATRRACAGVMQQPKRLVFIRNLRQPLWQDLSFIFKLLLASAIQIENGEWLDRKAHV